MAAQNLTSWNGPAAYSYKRVQNHALCTDMFEEPIAPCHQVVLMSSLFNTSFSWQLFEACKSAMAQTLRDCKDDVSLSPECSEAAH